MKPRRLIDLAAVLATLLGTGCGLSSLFAGEGAKQEAPTPDEAYTTSIHDDCDCCDPCASCDAGCGLWFGEAEALLWWRNSRPLPPLVTTSNLAAQGVLGDPSTQLLFGGNETGSVQPGGRAQLGRWFDESQTLGVVGSFFVLGQDEINYSRVAGGPTDVLAIPFMNANAINSFESALLVNFPGVTTNGRVDIQAQNDVMGGDAYLRYIVWQDGNTRVDVLGGYQFSRVDDSLRVRANYDDVAGLPNANFDLTDDFRVKNEFHGASLGLLSQTYSGPWSLVMMGKVGLGNMHQSVTIDGQTVQTSVGGGPVTVRDGGLFTQGTNIGAYSNNDFGVIPEARLQVNYQVNSRWSLGLGYSFIYWNNVLTAGNAVDRSVNITQIPGPIVGPDRPQFAFGERSDFWVQGLNFSAQFVY